jgi:peroxiredoxin
MTLQLLAKSKYFLLLVSCFTLFLLTQCSQEESQEKGIIIKATINTSQKGVVRLEKYGEGGVFELVDSIAVKGTSFEFKINVKEPEFYQIHYLGKKDIPLIITGEEKNIEIIFNHQKNSIGHQIKGSKDSEYYAELNQIFSKTKQQKFALEQKYAQNQQDEKIKNEVVNEFKELQKKGVEDLKNFISKVKPSLVAIVAANGLVAEEHFDFLKKTAEACQKKYPNSHYTKNFVQQINDIGQKLEKTKHLAVGQPAPEIELPNPDGKNIKLSSLKGKIVLVDFWASWCKPCRIVNPSVVKLYNKYKNKGFEILGVSLDRDKDAWLKAIEQDKLTWLHISDLQFWQSKAAQTYQIQAIPATYLIDKEGKILAKDLREKALEDKLEEVFKN